MSYLEANGVKHKVADDILFAVELMQREYGAKQGFSTGHQDGPRVTYDFPLHGGAQVLIPFNKLKLTLYLRDLTRDQRRLADLLHADKIGKRYPEDGDSLNSMRDGKSPYLKPGPNNRVLKVQLARSELRGVLDDYLLLEAPSAAATLPPLTPTPVEPTAESTTPATGRRPVSANQLMAQLDRNAKTGLAGEIIAYKYELERLHKCGCPKPKDYIKHIAPDDVGAGYDIASTWPADERFIEVKSTTRSGSDFFITENECQVLAALGEKAWLYRVVVGVDGTGEVVAQLQDPMNAISAEHWSPVVWRVSSEALDESSNT